jgi:hypothetical protein
MRPRRGCGCLVLVLAAVDIVFTISATIQAFVQSEPVKASLALSLLSAGILASNVVVCVMFALGAFRPGGDGTVPLSIDEEAESGDSEGEEDAQDQS